MASMRQDSGWDPARSRALPDMKGILIRRTSFDCVVDSRVLADPIKLCL